jgi:Na+-transporting NADH:ubiquinone oxidoreductase subunit NqrF
MNLATIKVARTKAVLTSLGIKLRFVQVIKDLFDGLDSTIPSDTSVPSACSCGTHCLGCNIHLEVTTDEELATHVGGLCNDGALKALL